MSALLLALAAQAAAPPSPAPAPAPAPASSSSTTSDSTSKGAYTYVDLEAGAGYSSNPNLEFGDNTGAAFGRISVHGVHTRVSERTTTVVSVFGQSNFYTNHHGSQQSVDVNARHDARVTENLRLFGDVDFAYDEGGQLDTRIISVPNVPPPPGSTLPPLLTPVGDFISVTGRQYFASGHIGAQLALGPRDFLTGTTGVEHSVFKSGGVDTRYTTIPVSIGYERQISTRTTVGGRMTAQFSDFDGPGNSQILTPALTFQTILSERISFNGAIGVSFAEVDNGINKEHSTGLAANAQLCSRGERSRLCAYASITQEAATAAGPAKTIAGGIDYSLQLDADQTIQFSVNANHYSTPTFFASVPTFSNATYIHAAADYTRRLGDRWFAGANLSARKDALSNGPDPKADISGSLFIRYRLGDLR